MVFRVDDADIHFQIIWHRYSGELHRVNGLACATSKCLRKPLKKWWQACDSRGRNVFWAGSSELRQNRARKIGYGHEQLAKWLWQAAQNLSDLLEPHARHQPREKLGIQQVDEQLRH